MPDKVTIEKIVESLLSHPPAHAGLLTASPPTMGRLFGLRPAKPITSAKDLGSQVKTTRRAMKLSQQKLADLAGVGRRFLSELERKVHIGIRQSYRCRQCHRY
jgi:hypothetical protein